MRDSQIVAELEPVLTPFGLELETVEVIPAGKRRLLRIVVDGDGPQGRGPSLDDIAEATKAISVALDASAAVGSAAYTLEVSSRGIGRPLEQPRHWRRNLGRLVRVNLRGGEQLTGRVTDSDDTGAELDLDGATRRVEFADVAKALVQIEFNRPKTPDDEDVVEDEVVADDESESED
jgi:ribosome maturation factor RimP